MALGTLLAAAPGLYVLGAIMALWWPKEKTPWVLAGFGGVGSLLLLLAGLDALASGTSFHASLWTVPGIGTLTVSADRLAGFFMAVTGLVAAPAALFAASWITRDRHPKTMAALFLGLSATLPIVIIAGDAFLFLLAWELMSILIYLLVASNGERPGYLMLTIGEAGTLAVLLAFLLLAQHAGGSGFDTLKTNGANLGTGIRWAVFLFSFFGFGVKAGLIPLNFWVARAYAAAPPSCIPLIAGATLNLALYGIIRINADLLPVTQIGPGIIILIMGALTALIGILYATIDDDFKAMLAHSSIENAGIITTAFGAGMLFLAEGTPVAAAIALIAALYHLLNHSVYKTLLFMGASVVEGAAGTRSLDLMGGLIKHLPWTALFMLVGVLSIAAMPPFNGFVSEWLTLQSLLRSVELASPVIKIAFVVAGALLALTAGLAATCFVRAFSMGFLGMPRSVDASRAGETRKPVLAAMAFLAIACLTLGILPTYVIPVIDQAVAPLAGASATDALVPPFFNKKAAAAELPQGFIADTHDIGAQVGSDVIPGRGLVVMLRGHKANPVVFAMSTSYMFVMLVGLLGLTAGFVWFFAARHRKIERRPRWDGGVRNLLPEMTYTATGFAQPVRVVFEAILRPDIVDKHENIAEHFQIAIQRDREEVHLIDRLVLHPLSGAAQWIANTLARMHHGRINTYAGYALLTLVIFLAIASLF